VFRSRLINYAGLSTSPGNITPVTSIQWFTSATKVFSRHTMKVGFDFRRYDANSLNPATPAVRSRSAPTT
jgi:hypothetical protein